MVQEEEETGDINECDRTCIELTDYIVQDTEVRWRIPTHRK